MYKRRKGSLQFQLKNYIFLLILIGVGCIIEGLSDPYISFRDYQDKLIEYGVLIQFIVGDVTKFLMGATILFMALNIKRNKLFVVSTAKLVGILGGIVILGAIVQMIARTIWYAPCTSHIMENALGVILIVISQILRIGIKMREENDLTI